MSSLSRKADICYVKCQYKKAMDLYALGYRKGDLVCSYKYAEALFNGKHIKKDEQLANEIFARISLDLKEKRKYVDANVQNVLGMMYLNGFGVPKNNDEAASWFKKSAQSGNDIGQYYLGYMYEKLYILERDWTVQSCNDKAISWYEKAAKQGNTQSQIKLGFLYRWKDNDRMFYWLTKAAKKGSLIAQSILWCFTLSISYCSTRSAFNFPYFRAGWHISEYCDIIRDCAQKYGCRLIELYKDCSAYDTIDGFHPNKNGMKAHASTLPAILL